MSNNFNARKVSPEIRKADIEDYVSNYLSESKLNKSNVKEIVKIALALDPYKKELPIVIHMLRNCDISILKFYSSVIVSYVESTNYQPYMALDLILEISRNYKPEYDAKKIAKVIKDAQSADITRVMKNYGKTLARA